MADPETTARLRSLIERLEDARERLERAEDSAGAVDVLQDIAELAKETQAEIERARRGGPEDEA